MTHRYFFISVMLLLLSVLHTHGQGIRGRVVDEHNRPLEFVNIVALSSDSVFQVGCMSNAQGEFYLELPAGNRKECKLRISFVGYQSRTLPCPENGEAGTIALAPTSQLLQETVVTAQCPTYQLTAGGIEARIAGSVLSQAGTANDVLSKLPSVEGNNGSYSVFGKGAAVIYLNGRPLYNPVLLEELRSEDIISVEIINNPGAQYDNTIKAVIKIKTRKKAGEGISGAAQGAYSQGERNGYNGMVYLNYRKQKLDIFGNVYYRRSVSKQEQSDRQTIYPDTQLEDEIGILTRMKNWSFMAGMNYEFSDKHSAGFYYNLSKAPYKAESDKEMTATSGTNPPEVTYYDCQWDSQSGFNHSINSYYNGQVGKLSIDFNADFLAQKNQKGQLLQEYKGQQLQQTPDSPLTTSAGRIGT